MVRIRLRRTGKKKQPSYRVVVADSESPRDGRFIENIGFYNPRTDPPTIEIQEDRARYWLSVGAQPSDPVVRLLRKVGILSGDEAVEAVDEPVDEQLPEAEAEPETEAEAEAETEVEAETEADEGAEDEADTEVESAAEAE
jgi:small subunit ribosomal protein S16